MRNPTNLQLDDSERAAGSIENPMRLMFRWRSHARRRSWSNIDALGQFEFERRYPHRAPNLQVAVLE
jgi:hypothetical protein